MQKSTRWVAVVAAAAVIAVPAVQGSTSAGVSPPAAAGAQAFGAPGDEADYTPADKSGYATARSRASHVWLTLEGGRMSEIYYPDISTPSGRSLDFIVSDGHSFSSLVSQSNVRTRLLDDRSGTYRQVASDAHHRWRLTTTFVPDPARSTVLVQTRLRSLTGHAYQLYTMFDPDLTGNGNDDTGATTADALVAHDSSTASALKASDGFVRASSGYVGTSDGWRDVAADHTMDWTFASAPDGNVVGTAMLRPDGVHRQTTTLAIGFAAGVAAAQQTATASLDAGFASARTAYAAGWHDYVRGLRPPPDSLRSAAERRAYRVSQVVLASSEDKVNPGAFVASPSMPWAWGFDDNLAGDSGPYHLVWPRDEYQIATGLLAEGDRAAAKRALTYMLTVQQQPDGHLPQNTRADGTPYWTSIQLDETADPIILAWQLHQTDAATWRHVRQAADFIVGFHQDGHAAPWTQQERWEEQDGYSPATIASEIAGLVCAADLARANGADARAEHYLRVADRWQRQVDDWTVTTNGPLSGQPYYVRLTKDGHPNSGTTYDLGNSGDQADQRAVVDPSFLELVRLGVKPAGDPVVRNTVRVVDDQLSVSTPNGRFWYRYSGDGYGETADGGPWDIGFTPGSHTTLGRLWPIFAGERGEYELLRGISAAPRLRAMAATSNGSGLMPEQVWDTRPPAGRAGYGPGTATFSATPLLWTHAQYVRLAWSIQAGHPVERPGVVARRYGG